MIHENEQRARLFRQLSAALRALAIAGSGQPVLFPEQIQSPLTLALDFDHSLSEVRAYCASDLSAAEAEALTALERKLATMSRDGAEFDADLWTEGAVADSPHWEEVRRLAAEALAVVQ